MEKNKEEVLLSKIEELTLKLEKIEQLLLTQKKVLNFNEIDVPIFSSSYNISTIGGLLHRITCI